MNTKNNSKFDYCTRQNFVGRKFWQICVNLPKFSCPIFKSGTLIGDMWYCHEVKDVNGGQQNIHCPRYFQLKSRKQPLPDPNRDLSSRIPSSVLVVTTNHASTLKTLFHLHKYKHVILASYHMLLTKRVYSMKYICYLCLPGDSNSTGEHKLSLTAV